MFIIEFAESIITWLVTTISTWGYKGIFILMSIESSFIPFPSEVSLIPAGILIAEGSMTWLVVLFAAIMGSIVGALINYYLALHLGRSVTKKLLIKYGKLLLIQEKMITKSEEYFKNHGEMTIFVSRLLPAIRQLISLPAGFARMDLKRFCGYTALGSGLWSAIVVWVGYFYGSNQAAIHQHLTTLTFGVIAIVAVSVGVYVIARRRSKK